MFTVCPKCTLTLAVTANDLRLGQGYVRCGRCANVFNALLSLSQEAVKAGAPGSSAYGVPGALLLAGPDWLAPLALLAFGLGALCYYWVFYQSRLIPRWLSGRQECTWREPALQVKVL